MKYLIPAALAVLAIGLFQSGAEGSGGYGTPTPKATPTPKVTATPKASPSPTATPKMLSCEEMLRQYAATPHPVNGPPCVQVGMCGYVGHQSSTCPPRPTPTAVMTSTPSPSPTTTPRPTPPPASSGGGGGETSSTTIEEEPTPVRAAPPVLVPRPASPCEVLISLFNVTGKNAAQTLVTCNGGPLPGLARGGGELPPNLRLPNAGG